MRLGVNATFLNEKPTGIGIFTREISRCIAKINRETAIFSPVPIGGASDSLYRVPLSIKGSLKFSDNLARIFYINTALQLHCRTKRLEVLFCPMTEFPFMSVMPLVVHVHDLHPVHFPSQFKLSAHHFRLSLKLLNRLVKRVTVSSDFVKRELLTFTNVSADKIDVIPSGCDRNIFSPQSIGSKRDFLAKYSLRSEYILYVGNFFPYKNVKTLIEAFLRIKNRISHSLVLIGRQELSSEQLPSDDRILYMDYVPTEDLPKFYSYAALLAHPSLSEGFGFTPLEAMACGVPVLASNRGAVPEVVGDAGILFDPVDCDLLGRLILDVINNEKMLKELVGRGLERVKKFTWEKSAEGILDSCEKAGKRNSTT